MSNATTVVHQLIKDKDKAKLNEAGWKAEGKRLNAELATIVQPEEHLKAAKKDKTGGSTTVTEYGAKFSVECEKDVKWDSKKLQAVAANMTWKQVEDIFKIKFEISEAVYKQLKAGVAANMFPVQVMQAIDDARTVTIGEAKITSAEIIN